MECEQAGLQPVGNETALFDIRAALGRPTVLPIADPRIRAQGAVSLQFTSTLQRGDAGQPERAPES